MSSALNNSSADKSASSKGTAGASDVASSIIDHDLPQNVDNLLAYFSTIMQSKLPVAEQDIDPARSPELETIKMETKGLPDGTFKALSEIYRVITAHSKEMAVYRSKAANNDPLPDCPIEEQYNSLMLSGNAIMSNHRKFVSQRIGFVDKSREELTQRIREAFGQAENIKHWQERLDDVKDDIVPQTSTLFAPVESAAKVAVGLTVCNVSQKLEQQLTDLGISGEASRGDMQTIIKTRSKLKDYIRDSEFAGEHWIYICQAIYPTSAEGAEDSSATILLRRIDLAERQISRVISPIEDYLVRWNANYGSGITVIREVDDFCNVVPKIIEDIERIFGAKEIIRSCHRTTFEATVYELGSTIFKYLGLMRENFNQKTIDPEKQRQFQQELTLHLTSNTVRLSCALRTILDTQSCSRKSEKAEKNRKADDRCFEDGIWKNKTLVKPSEVLSILERVRRAVDTIYCLANASGTGKIVESISGNKVERADFKLDISIEPLRRLHRVLGEDVEAGLERLEKLLIQKEPKAHAGQIKSFLRKFNRHKC